jgi:hypothetical protein
VSVNELIRLLQLFWNLLILHNLNLLLKNLMSDEHLVVHLQLRHFFGRTELSLRNRSERCGSKLKVLQVNLGERGGALGVGGGEH